MARPVRHGRRRRLPLHEDWVGHRVTALEAATGGRVAFVVRFGTGVLPDQKTVIQAGDQSTCRRVRHIAEAMAIAALPPSTTSMMTTS